MLNQKVFYPLMVFFSICAGALVGSAKADPVDCPNSVARLPQDQTTLTILARVADVYQQLGCKTEFVELPAVRGNLHFNRGLIDGELFRLRAVEASYTRDFVRSTEPLMVLPSILWLHPQLKYSDRLPLGYLHGVVWQEAYMEGRQGRYFHRPHEMFEAYNNGELRGFLANDISVKAYNTKNPFTPYPDMAEVISNKPVYHYVAAKYADFIKAFSKTLHERRVKQSAGR